MQLFEAVMNSFPILKGLLFVTAFFFFSKKYKKFQKTFLTCSKGEQVNCDNIAIEGKRR